MDWSEFLALREPRRMAALDAAQRLRGGDLDAAGRLLGGWRFSSHQDLLRVVSEGIQRSEAHPSSTHAAIALAAMEQLPDPPSSEREGTVNQHRRRLEGRLGELSEGFDPIAFALAELSWLGESIENSERKAWKIEEYRADPVRDEVVRGMWEAWFDGTPWSIRDGWEEIFLDPARRVFRAVLEAGRVPLDARRRCVDDLGEAFFFALVGGRASETIGWVELAVRTMESHAQGPLPTLCGVLPAERWDLVSRCAVSRGHWVQTAGRIWPGHRGTRARALALRAEGRRDRDVIERLLDLHVAMRLIENWASPAVGSSLDRDWTVVTQNRGRARGRLRAVVSGDPEAVRSPLLALDALYARTLAAVKRYAWAWAWSEARLGFSFSLDRPVTPACVVTEAGLEPVADAAVPHVRTWLLLVILRGRLDHLRRWASQGGTGERDSTWARLLAQDLPESLRDPVQPGRRTRTYQRLRAHLGDHLEEHLSTLAPRVRAIGELPIGRGLRRGFEALVGPFWSSAVSLPRAGFPSFVANAERAIPTIEEAPCPVP